MRHRHSHPEKLRVCHFAMGDLWAGAEVQLATLMRYLVRVPGLQLSVLLLNEGKLADILRLLGVPVTVIPESSHGMIGLLARIIRLIWRVRPHILHTHKYKDNILGSLAAKILHVPHVVRTVHGLPEPFRGIDSSKMASYQWLDRLLSVWAVEKFVAVSENIQCVLKEKVLARKVMCIHNGIDLENTRIGEEGRGVRRALGIELHEILIGTVGRLTEVKAHDKLLEAASLLIASGHKLKVILIGDGPLDAKLKDLASQLGIEKNVIFAGHRENALEFVNILDVFVLPSMHEGIPMALLEALALERPVVASRVGGIPEVIEHGVSGILVAPGDARLLADSIRTVIEDRAFASSLGNAGGLRVQQEFGGALMAERMTAMYRSLCSDLRS